MIEILSFLILVFWLLKGIPLIAGVLLFLPRLKREAVPPPAPAPKVSIIFSARNEAGRMKDTVGSMLAQDYPHYEVIAVNDRSTDETRAELTHFLGRKNFRLIDITDLPMGWLGKTHALYQGYLASSGEWLLFTDADVHFHPATLKTVMHAVQVWKLDHLTVFPQMVTKKFIEAIFVNYFIFAFCLRFRPWLARRRGPRWLPGTRAYAGVGAFNLVHLLAYEKVGTHQKISLEVVDDMMLAKTIKESGGRQMAAIGTDLICVRWVEGFRGVIRSLEKNAFAGFHYSLWLLLAATLVLFFLDVMPFVLPFFVAGPAFESSLLSLGIIFLAYVSLSRLSGTAPLTFPFHPLAYVLMSFIAWRSALSILQEGGVMWRDTFYSLKELKKACRGLG